MARGHNRKPEVKKKDGTREDSQISRKRQMRHKTKRPGSFGKGRAGKMTWAQFRHMEGVEAPAGFAVGDKDDEDNN